MKFKSHVFAQTSGSVAGLTYSHNKGGMYTRARATPINPATPPQQAIRATMKALTTRWQNVLTQIQRDAWTTYAINVPIVNRLGEPHIIPALSMYVRCNAPRLLTGPATPTPLGPVDDGPTVFALATFPVPTVTLAPAVITTAFDNTADWAIATGGALNIYMSRGQSPTINFFKGPFQFAQRVDGSTMTPPTSPATTGANPVPFVITIGLKYFIRYQVSNADGRLSSSYIIAVIAA